MQHLRCLFSFSVQNNAALKPQILTPNVSKLFEVIQKSKYNSDERKSHWLTYNDTFFPIQGPNEERRPAYVCHSIENVKYSLKKMWYIAVFIRGMTIDEALKQLSFLPKKGATIVKDALLEAQRKAVEEHNVEFKSNLWVAESFCNKGIYIKGIRRHAKGRAGKVEYKYCHYYVRLEEGKPPKHYYLPYPKTADQLLEDYMNKIRRRKVTNSL